MLNIIDNVNLPSKTNSSINPWLETLLDKAKVLSPEMFVLRLTATRKPSYIVYYLENSNNKTMAQISKKGTTLRIETFRRELPDPEKYIKPPYAPVTAGFFEMTPEGLDAAAKALCDVVGVHTPYSEQTVLKAKVYPSPNENDPWCLTGGLITGIEYMGNDELKITVDKGGTHKLKLHQLCSKTPPRLLKHLVMDSRAKAQVVNTSEYGFYFETING